MFYELATQKREKTVKCKILVIDDEVEICRLLEKFLTKQGYRVMTETSAAKGIEKVRAERPGIVLLDVRMPEIDGIEATRRIREFDKGVGIIIATAVTDEETVRALIEAGASDYIEKPFDLDYLEKSLLSKIALLG